MKRSGLSLRIGWLLNNKKANSDMEEFCRSMKIFRDQLEYKMQSDSVLLSRGRKPGIHLGTSGKSVDAVLCELLKMQR